MRKKMGRGETLVFDNNLIDVIEKLNSQLGYYPCYREISETFGGERSVNVISSAVRRLVREHKLSPDATKIYDRKKAVNRSGRRHA